MSGPLDGPLRIEVVDCEIHVLGEGISCACETHEEAEALLRDLRLRFGNPLIDRIRVAFKALSAKGWITRIEPDRTGAICRAFDRDPDAPGYAALLHPLPDDHAVVEVGQGIGDEDEDAQAAHVVAAELERAGLRVEVHPTQTGEDITVRLPEGGA
jgi:hypothetical protein